MNKTSVTFIVLGILVLGVIGYIALKPKQNQLNSSVNKQTNVNPNPTEPPPPSVFEIIIDYKNANPVEPKSFRVEGGQKVVIKTTADVTDEVHLHGYDISVDVKPGEVATLDFTANKTGRFPIELEGIKKDIGIIEVYPK